MAEEREVNDVSTGSNGESIMTSDLGKNVNQGAISEQGSTVTEAIQATQEESQAANKEMQEEKAAAAAPVDPKVAAKKEKLERLRKVLAWKIPEIPKIPSMADLLNKIGSGAIGLAKDFGNSIKDAIDANLTLSLDEYKVLLEQDGLLGKALSNLVDTLVGGFLLGKIFIPDTVFLAGVTATWYGGGDFDQEDNYIRRLAVRRDITLVLKFLDAYDNYRITYTGDSNDPFRGEMRTAAEYGAHENVGYYLREIKKSYDDLKNKFMSKHPRFDELEKYKRELETATTELRIAQLNTLIKNLENEIIEYDNTNRMNFMDIFGFVVELCKLCIVYSYGGFLLDGKGVSAENPLAAMDTNVGRTGFTLADMFNLFPELSPSMFGDHDIVFGGRYRFSTHDIDTMVPFVDEGLLGNFDFGVNLGINTRWTYMRLKLERARAKNEKLGLGAKHVLDALDDFLTFTKPRNKNIKRLYCYMLNLENRLFAPTECLLKITGGREPERFIYHPEFYERLRVKTLTTGMSLLNNFLGFDLSSDTFKNMMPNLDHIYDSALDYAKSVEDHLYDPSKIEYWTTPSDVTIIRNLPDLASMTGDTTLPGVSIGDRESNNKIGSLISSQLMIAYLTWFYPQTPSDIQQSEYEANFQALIADFDATWLMSLLVTTPYKGESIVNLYPRIMNKIGGFKNESGNWLNSIRSGEDPLLSPGLVGGIDFNSMGERPQVWVPGFNFDKDTYFPPKNTDESYNPWVNENVFFYNILHNIETDIGYVYDVLFDKKWVEEYDAEGNLIPDSGKWEYGKYSLFHLSKPSNSYEELMKKTSIDDTGSISSLFLARIIKIMNDLKNDNLKEKRSKHIMFDLETIIVNKLKHDSDFNYTNNQFEPVANILHRRDLGKKFLVKFIETWEQGLNLDDLNPSSDLDPKFNSDFNNEGFGSDFIIGINTIDNGGSLSDMLDNMERGEIPNNDNSALYKRADNILTDKINNGDVDGWGDINKSAQDELDANLSLDNSQAYTILDENGVEIHKGSINELKELEDLKKFLDSDEELFDFDPANPSKKVIDSMNSQLGMETLKTPVYKYINQIKLDVIEDFRTYRTEIISNISTLNLFIAEEENNLSLEIEGSLEYKAIQRKLDVMRNKLEELNSYLEKIDLWLGENP